MMMISSSRRGSILRLYNSDDHEITWFFISLILLHFPPRATAQTTPDPPESNSFGPTISKNVAIALVILVCFFFVLGFLTVYTRHCTQYRFSREIGISVPNAATNAQSRRAEGIGLDATIIESFPTFVYSAVKALKIGKNSLECAVCLNEFVDDDMLRLLPKCNHVFHSDCIDAWLVSHSTCPVCRVNLFPKPGDLAFTLLRNSNRDSSEESEPDRGSELIQPAENYDHQGRNIEAADVNLISPRTNQQRPPRSRSTGWRFGGKFQRSHSTGHSLVQPGESCERFRLRLPEEVRREILNSSLNRARSCVAFPRVQSSRQGYRSASGGSGRGRGGFMMESGSNRWTLLLSTPFFGREGSSRTQKAVVRVVADVGERSFVRLRADGNSKV